jgi:ABC-type sulfate transport system permease component
MPEHSGATFWDVFALLFVVALVYVLVRPRSKAGALVEGFMNMFIALVRQATDLANA